MREEYGGLLAAYRVRKLLYAIIKSENEVGVFEKVEKIVEYMSPIATRVFCQTLVIYL